MKKLSDIIFGKKLNYLLSAVWVFLIVQTWFPFLGEPADTRFRPIWRYSKDEFGNNWLNDRQNLFPSIDIFLYSSALLVTLMAALFVVQSFAGNKNFLNMHFEKLFLYLAGLLALSGGWYRLADYDTEVLLRVVKQFIFGFYNGLANSNSDQIFIIPMSITFWIVILRLIIKRK